MPAGPRTSPGPTHPPTHSLIGVNNTPASRFAQLLLKNGISVRVQQRCAAIDSMALLCRSATCRHHLHSAGHPRRGRFASSSFPFIRSFQPLTRSLSISGPANLAHALGQHLPSWTYYYYRSPSCRSGVPHRMWSDRFEVFLSFSVYLISSSPKSATGFSTTNTSRSHRSTKMCQYACRSIGREHN